MNSTDDIIELADTEPAAAAHRVYDAGRVAPDVTDPRFPAITRTVWELDDGRRLTNELDADGCRHVVGPPDADD